MRQTGLEALRGLDDEVHRHTASGSAETGAAEPLFSWLDGEPLNALACKDPLRVQFELHGFAHLKGFASEAECAGMIEDMAQRVDQWDPATENPVAFRTDDEQEGAQGASDYFTASADRVHFFAEVDAMAEEGDGEGGGGGGLKPGLPKLEALNKAGHGLHVCDGRATENPFRAYAHSDKITSLIRRLGWSAPVLPQSMYIFKQPRIGGEVTSHQDSCFLYTTPRQSCLGLWLALHDATLENGCLWVRPGSHREELRRVFLRDEASGVMEFEPAGPDATVQAQLGHRGQGLSVGPCEWEGALPEGSWPPPSDGLFAAGFVPVECKAGDLLAFPGLLDHLSLPNTSDAPRHTFQLHLVEGPRAGVTWHDRNWLQYPEGRAFPELRLKNAQCSGSPQ